MHYILHLALVFIKMEYNTLYSMTKGMNVECVEEIRLQIEKESKTSNPLKRFQSITDSKNDVHLFSGKETGWAVYIDDENHRLYLAFKGLISRVFEMNGQGMIDSVRRLNEIKDVRGFI